MRKLAFAFILFGLTFACAATPYHSQREMRHQPFYTVVVTFYKEDISAGSADHRFILEAKWEDAAAPLGYRVSYTQCDRGETNSEFVECLLGTNNPEMKFNILQVWENPDSHKDVSHDPDTLTHKGPDPVTSYLCGNVAVGVSASELPLTNNGLHDPQYTFNLPSDNGRDCGFQITDRTLVNANKR